ncbi:MAG: DNA gyrase subunit A [Candidatus Taylorbacteria bacterium RIFCSPHIGHO2_01_FULL_51_15]|uniref:DNA gyrase subunit A n=1 Tax=Candidatus Taylorbacteria bacterium RIFCSPHIGHO2_01_FULL_51_15 TaxID=1802304 RepID=A0A1G2MBU1_9BACT|nr:MAG: DNA gyrase subunit A [Candidatus Taylorbacteria bacterium RIFCSPHIGHO2_01_FULL_51_15]
MAASEPKEATKRGVIGRSITTEMKESYLDYAMSVITARALPDVRDGLKPVHRRILYAMNGMGLSASAKTRKSATVVGDVLGKYHPHGDTSVYDAMVKMAQTFSFRYPLVIGQGNFGSQDGDAAAAYRYTEAKMSRIAGELLRDIEKETVDWRPNYDGTHKEPVVLPAAVPNLLLNGTLGIAVGMATNIPPHNLREVVAATVHLMEHEDATTEDLLQFVTGPDFPTGGIVFGSQDLRHAYSSGKGGVVTRGVAEIVENKSGQMQIIITSIPYRVNKAEMIIQIANLVREKKVDGIKGLRDESTSDVRVVIDLKQGSFPEKVLNFLYKHTQLEETFHFNTVALVNGVPQTLSLKALLEQFIIHRKEVVKRRTAFDLKQAEAREHILLGLKKALDHIDEIIKLIKKSKDVDEARAGLQKAFKFSEIQAQAILDMRLQKLSGLERKKIEDELMEVQALIAELKSILGSTKKILAVIKKELQEIGEKYGDDRRTRVMKHGAKEFSEEDLIPDTDAVLVLTKGGYIKRTDPEEYRKQRRGGVGVVDLDTKDEDFVTHVITGTTHNDFLFFTDKGKAYQIKMYEIPEGKRATKGKSIMNFLSLAAEEKVTSILPMPKSVKAALGLSLLMVTRNGIGKKTAAASFHDVRRSGLLAIKLKEGDELVSASFVEKGDEAVLVTKKGQSIRFKESDIREMGRGAGGVKAMRLSKGDSIVGTGIVHPNTKTWSVHKGKSRSNGGTDIQNSTEEMSGSFGAVVNKTPASAKGSGEATPELLVIMQNGYGKKTKLKEYKTQKRGGSGIKTAKITPKTGELIAAHVVTSPEEEVVAISKKSQVIRTGVNEIASLGRQTQGVRIMKLREGDSIASLTCL